jgi:hypothetical protein
MAKAKLIRYAEDARPEDTERAFETVKPSLFPNETKPVAIDFSGTCPRCGHPIQHREWLVAVAGSLRVNNKQMEALLSHLDEIGIDLSRGDETIDITCPCDEEHPGRPENKRGCGARFRVRVTWGP